MIVSGTSQRVGSYWQGSNKPICFDIEEKINNEGTFLTLENGPSQLVSCMGSKILLMISCELGMSGGISNRHDKFIGCKSYHFCLGRRRFCCKRTASENPTANLHDVLYFRDSLEPEVSDMAYLQLQG